MFTLGWFLCKTSFMKAIYCICIFLTLTSITHAQPAAQNFFVITIDGTRWQEIFKGADEALLRNINYVKDTTLMLKQYSHPDREERRRRLMPFFGRYWHSRDS